MELFCVFIFLLIRLFPVIGEFSQDLSHGSIVMEEGKPILRSHLDGDALPKDGFWLADLKSGIASLVNEHGYEGAKPYINKLVTDAEKAHKVKLSVNVKKSNGKHKSGDETRRLQRMSRQLTQLIPHSPQMYSAPPQTQSRSKIENLEYLRERIHHLVSTLGYDKAKQYIQHAVDETEEILRAQISVKGRSQIYYYLDNPEATEPLNPSSPSPNEQNERDARWARNIEERERRWARNIDNSYAAIPPITPLSYPALAMPLLAPDLPAPSPRASSTPTEPDWKAGFTNFVKSLLNAYSKADLMRHLQSGALEKAYGINLKTMNSNPDEMDKRANELQLGISPDILSNLAEQQRVLEMMQQNARRSDLWNEQQMKEYEQFGQHEGLRSNMAREEWQNDFKMYVKSLMMTLPRDKLLERLTPVIESVQKRHKVSIDDIDVDETGNVYLNINDLSGRSGNKKKKKKVKKERDDFLRSFPSITDIHINDRPEKKPKPKYEYKKTKVLRSGRPVEDQLSSSSEAFLAYVARREGDEYDDTTEKPDEKPNPIWAHELELYGKYLYEKLEREDTADYVHHFQQSMNRVINDYENKYNARITGHYDGHAEKYIVKVEPIADFTYHEHPKWGPSYGKRRIYFIVK